MAVSELGSFFGRFFRQNFCLIVEAGRLRHVRLNHKEGFLNLLENRPDVGGCLRPAKTGPRIHSPRLPKTPKSMSSFGNFFFPNALLAFVPFASMKAGFHMIYQAVEI